MSNTTFNRIDAALDPQTIETVKGAIASIRQALPFLIGLTPHERMSLPKINVSNKVFTEDAILAAINNPGLLPAFIKPADMTKDLELYQGLDELVVLIRQLAEEITDTQTLAGSEAYASGLTIYKIIGAAATSGLPGSKTLYEQLRQRFSSQGGQGTTGAEPVAPAS